MVYTICCVSVAGMIFAMLSSSLFLVQVKEFAANHIFLASAFVILLVLTFVNEMKRARQKFSILTPAEVVQLMNDKDRNSLLLDVREAVETKSGKIAKALQIPLSGLAVRITELEKSRDHHIIVYCKNGTRSAVACKQLNSAGFGHVYSLDGGIAAWQEAYMPLSKK